MVRIENILRAFSSSKRDSLTPHQKALLIYNHTLETKEALGVGAVFTTSHYWRYTPKTKEEQGGEPHSPNSL